MSSSRGFTLVEMLVASAVFAFGFAGVITMQTAAGTYAARANHLNMATQLTQNKMERLRSLPTAKLSTLASGTQTTYDADGLPTSKSGAGAPMYTVTLSFAPDSGRSYSWLDVGVVCDWQESDSSAHKVQLFGLVRLP